MGSDTTFDDVMYALGNPSVPDDISPEEKQEICEKYATFSEKDRRQFKERLHNRIMNLQNIMESAQKHRRDKYRPPLAIQNVSATAEGVRRFSKLYDILKEYDNLKTKSSP